MYTVRLMYFKSSGKYYAQGEYSTNMEGMWAIFAEVKAMLSRGQRPGLVDGHSGYSVVVDCPEHPHNHPALMMGKA